MAENPNGSILGSWNGEFVRQYSTAQLSVKSDRLVALAGVIKAIQDHTGWKNIHGLWEPYMFDQLLWKSSCPERRRRISSAVSTWSWGSIETDVAYSPYSRSDRPGAFLARLETIENTPLVTPALTTTPRARQLFVLEVSCLASRTFCWKYPSPKIHLTSEMSHRIYRARKMMWR
jgi:hypothetical protein